MADLTLSRRILLAGATALLAGCAGDATTDDSAPASPTRGGSTSLPGDETTVSSDELDLREANVTAVSVTDNGDGSYRFSVTLYHDDDGEDGYANWWQVERRDGTKLGRRTLLHAHSTDPFTRSETIELPDDVDCVVVRGHDQTHGYGGQAMLVDPDNGATRLVSQGRDRQSADGLSCP